MRKEMFAAFAVLLGFHSAAAAQTDTLQSTAAPATAQPACARPALADTAELAPVAGSNLMTVPVSINGTARLFLLDVGRTPDQVSEATMAELHLPQTTQMTGISGLSDLNTAISVPCHHV